MYPLPYSYLCQNPVLCLCPIRYSYLCAKFIRVSKINSDIFQFHFRFNLDADVLDLNMHFLRVFFIVTFHPYAHQTPLRRTDMPNANAPNQYLSSASGNKIEALSVDPLSKEIGED